MKNRKYKMCSGLSFSDKEDMEMLHRYALDGWVFREVRFGVLYELHKEEPKDLIFSYDSTDIKKEDKNDYLKIFAEANWYPVGKWNQGIHFFYAENGTLPLHTEQETRDVQYKKILNMSIGFLLIAIVIMLVGINIHNFYVFIIGSALLGGSAMSLIGSLARVKGKRIAINSRTYGYQLFKFVLAVTFTFLYLFLKTKANSFNGRFIMLCIIAGFYISAIYGTYVCYKESKYRK